MPAQHPLERRASMLATRIKVLRDALRDAVAAPGERPPFTEHHSAAEAFAWWRLHRHDEYGQRVVERMRPEQVARLDLWLAKGIEAERDGGVA